MLIPSQGEDKQVELLNSYRFFFKNIKNIWRFIFRRHQVKQKQVLEKQIQDKLFSKKQRSVTLESNQQTISNIFGQNRKINTIQQIKQKKIKLQLKGLGIRSESQLRIFGCFLMIFCNTFFQLSSLLFNSIQSHQLITDQDIEKLSSQNQEQQKTFRFSKMVSFKGKILNSYLQLEISFLLQSRNQKILFFSKIDHTLDNKVTIFCVYSLYVHFFYFYGILECLKQREQAVIKNTIGQYSQKMIKYQKERFFKTKKQKVAQLLKADFDFDNIQCNFQQLINLQLKKNMSNRMMLPIQLTKILYQNWEGQISTSSQDSEIYGKCLNGPAKVTFKNGNKYEGQFYNGLLHGKGVFIWANGIVYDGEFTDNRITGKGTYKWPDGSTYDGEVKDGLRHGFGKYMVDDATYQGEWFQGKKQGKGKITFKSGSVFEGNFKNDLKHGYGKMYYYPSGNYFEGEWKQDVKCGMGTMNWTDIRQKYVGQWKNNQQEGWGMHIWLQSKGQGKYMRNRYEGNWKNGVRDGYGVFYYANGSKYEGYWKNNMKEGYSFYTDQNGKVSLILFEKDRMIKGQKPAMIENENTKKVPNKKEVEPNLYSLCLNIDHFYLPATPNLEHIYNYLLRNNTQLKSWYKNAASFYDQQSQFSFCLNLQGIWKMIRSLKILGQFSIAEFNRGVPHSNPDIQTLLKITPKAALDRANYQDIYYRHLGSTINPDLHKLKQLKTVNFQVPFKEYSVHDRQINILFRQFVHLLVWMSHHLDSQFQKPQKSIQKLITKIAPFLDSINKVIKSTVSQNMSQNKSSISKAEKSITPFYKNLNQSIFKAFVKDKTNALLGRKDYTIKIYELLGLGRLNGCIGEAEWVLLQKIIQKYFDNQIIGRQKNENWSNSTIPSKILNILNYDLIEYEFIQIIYILFIKKLPSTKQTEENKKKYQDVVQDLFKAKKIHDQKIQAKRQFNDEVRYVISDKSKAKKILQEKRRLMQQKKAKEEAQARQRQRQQRERELMALEDTNIKDQQFQEQPSQFQI